MELPAPRRRRRSYSGCPFRARMLITLAVLVVLLPSISSGYPVDDPSSFSSRSLHLRQLSTNNGNVPDTITLDNSTSGCGFQGDGDMYGLGIRLGYYIQWLATVLGAYFTPEMVHSAFDANAIFNIGMLAGLVFSTIVRTDLNVVEPILVLGFSIGGAIVGLLDPKNMHNPKSMKSLRARLVHLAGTSALSLPLLIYWAWYSFYGMDLLTFDPCGTYAFFIVRVNIWDRWYRVFMKVATVLAFVGLFGMAVAVMVMYRLKSGHLPENDTWRLSRTPSVMARRARPTKTQFSIVIFACVLCALSVELSIKWNHIDGVQKLGSTGQLIPLTISIVTCVKLLLGVMAKSFHQTLRSRRKRRKQERVFGTMGMRNLREAGGEMDEEGPESERVRRRTSTLKRSNSHRNSRAMSVRSSRSVRSTRSVRSARSGRSMAMTSRSYTNLSTGVGSVRPKKLQKRYTGGSSRSTTWGTESGEGGKEEEKKEKEKEMEEDGISKEKETKNPEEGKDKEKETGKERKKEKVEEKTADEGEDEEERDWEELDGEGGETKKKEDGTRESEKKAGSSSRGRRWWRVTS